MVRWKAVKEHNVLTSILRRRAQWISKVPPHVVRPLHKAWLSVDFLCLGEEIQDGRHDVEVTDEQKSEACI